MKKWELCKIIHNILQNEMIEDDLISLDDIMNSYHQKLNADVINLIEFTNEFGMILPAGTNCAVYGVSYSGDSLLFELIADDSINDMHNKLIDKDEFIKYIFPIKFKAFEIIPNALFILIRGVIDGQKKCK